MLIYNDIFTWKGGPPAGETLWLRSCRLWVIDLTRTEDQLLHLKPFIVVVSDINSGPGRKICTETIGKQIFNEFRLDIKRTLWIEYAPDTNFKLMVANFIPKYHDGDEMIYSIKWRRLISNETEIIKKYIPSLFTETMD